MICFMLACSHSFVYGLRLHYQLFKRGEIMKEIIKKSEELIRLVKQKENEIDNPVLTLGLVTELKYFIENIKDDE